MTHIKQLLAIGLLTFGLVSANSALAHELLTDGTIGAVLHIEPEDDPIVGQTATFYLDFKDQLGKFTPQKCDCVARVIRDGQVLYQTKLFSATSTEDNASELAFSYLFPAKATYTIVIFGTPFHAGDFTPFSLKEDLLVNRESPSSAPKNPFLSAHLIHLILYGLAFAGTGVFAYLQHRSKKRA